MVERLDRLARDLMVQKTIAADLRKYGFELVSVAEPDLMATDPTRIRVRQMMGAVAQYEKSQIVLKLRGARLRKRVKEGRCEGRKPFGFDEGEAAAVCDDGNDWRNRRTRVCRAPEERTQPT